MSAFVSRAMAAWPLLFCLLAACASPAPAPKAPASLADLATNSLATIDGDLKVPGLKEPVEVVRDKEGIPHIYAKNDEDLFFAQGYVMAQDRLWQLELWRRWREGRLAEVFGPKAFDIDARTRLTMFRGPWDAAEWTSYHPDAERLFTALANGHNAYLAANADHLPIEFTLTGIKPEPWTAKTVVLRWASLAVDSVRGQAIQEIQLALSVKKLGVKEANRLAAPDPWDDLKVPEGLDLEWFTDELLAAARKGEVNPFEPGALPSPAILETYRSQVPARQARLMPELQDMDGSNNWVVSGKHTASGVPILSNDPHRTIEMPALRYFVHLSAPGWNVIGARRAAVCWRRCRPQRHDGVGLHVCRYRHGGRVRRGDQPRQPERNEIQRRLGADDRDSRRDSREGRGAAERRAEVLSSTGRCSMKTRRVILRSR